MAKKDKLTKAEKGKKKNLKKSTRYARAAKRKGERASKMSDSTSKKRGRKIRLQQEASNFAKESRRIKKAKGQGKPEKRTSMQVTKRSSAQKLKNQDKRFKYSSGGRKLR